MPVNPVFTDATLIAQPKFKFGSSSSTPTMEVSWAIDPKKYIIPSDPSLASLSDTSDNAMVNYIEFVVVDQSVGSSVNTTSLKIVPMSYGAITNVPLNTDGFNFVPGNKYTVTLVYYTSRKDGNTNPTLKYFQCENFNSFSFNQVGNDSKYFGLAGGLPSAPRLYTDASYSQSVNPLYLSSAGVDTTTDPAKVQAFIEIGMDLNNIDNYSALTQLILKITDVANGRTYIKSLTSSQTQLSPDDTNVVTGLVGPYDPSGILSYTGPLGAIGDTGPYGATGPYDVYGATGIMGVTYTTRVTYGSTGSTGSTGQTGAFGSINQYGSTGYRETSVTIATPLYGSDTQFITNSLPQEQVKGKYTYHHKFLNVINCDNNTLLNITKGSKYYVTVDAVNAMGHSYNAQGSANNVISLTVSTTPKPTNLASDSTVTSQCVHNVSEPRVGLKWNNDGYSTSYNIQKSSDNGVTWSSPINVLATPGNSRTLTTWTDTETVVAWKIYQYKIQGQYNTYGNTSSVVTTGARLYTTDNKTNVRTYTEVTGYSNAVTVIPQVALNNASNLKVYETSQTRMKLSWKLTDTNTQRFLIVCEHLLSGKKITSDEINCGISEPTGDGLDFTATHEYDSFVNENEYKYTVYAMIDIGSINLLSSTGVSKTTRFLTFPEPVTNLMVSNIGSNNVKFTFSKNNYTTMITDFYYSTSSMTKAQLREQIETDKTKNRLGYLSGGSEFTPTWTDNSKSPLVSGVTYYFYAIANNESKVDSQLVFNPEVNYSNTNQSIRNCMDLLIPTTPVLVPNVNDFNAAYDMTDKHFKLSWTALTNTELVANNLGPVYSYTITYTDASGAKTKTVTTESHSASQPISINANTFTESVYNNDYSATYSAKHEYEFTIVTNYKLYHQEVSTSYLKNSAESKYNEIMKLAVPRVPQNVEGEPTNEGKDLLIKFKMDKYDTSILSSIKYDISYKKRAVLNYTTLSNISVATNNEGVNEYTINGVTDNSLYDVYVTATLTPANSIYTNVPVLISISNAPEITSRNSLSPTIKESSAGDQSITVTWEPPSYNLSDKTITKYKVYINGKEEGSIDKNTITTMTFSSLPTSRSNFNYNLVNNSEYVIQLVSVTNLNEEVGYKAIDLEVQNTTAPRRPNPPGVTNTLTNLSTSIYQWFSNATTRYYTEVTVSVQTNGSPVVDGFILVTPFSTSTSSSYFMKLSESMDMTKNSNSQVTDKNGKYTAVFQFASRTEDIDPHGPVYAVLSSNTGNIIQNFTTPPPTQPHNSNNTAQQNIADDEATAKNNIDPNYRAYPSGAN